MSAWRWPLLVVLTAAAVGCTGHDAARDRGRLSAGVVFRSDTSADGYFPAPGIDPLLGRRYGRTLLEMGEPPFPGAQLPGNVRVLRFLWARSFHPTIAVRIVRRAGHCRVTTTVQALPETTWGAPDSMRIQTALSTQPGAILRRDSTDVAVHACENLEQDLIASGLWTTTPFDDHRGVDGTGWIFEAMDSRGHHVMERWSPDSTHAPNAWRAGVAFLRLGKALPPRRDIY